MELANSIGRLKGMGPKTAAVFANHGIQTVEDLLYFFPRGWINATQIRKLNELRLEESGLVEVQVVSIKQGMSLKTRKPYFQAVVADSSGAINIVWFYAVYLKQKIKPGVQLKLYGRVRNWGRESRAIFSPRFITEPCIIPVYPEIGGLISSKIRVIMQQLKPLLTAVPDYLPESVRTEQHLLSLPETIEAMHFPSDLDMIIDAKKRLGFDELLMLVVPSLIAKEQRGGEIAEAILNQKEKIEQWLKAVPFSLTNDQHTAIHDILSDMSQTKPMNRLLQGDVGSGKTIVGLAAAYQTILNDKQAVWLAPTELLAKQHFETAKQLMPSLYSVGLWTRTQHLIASKDNKVSSDDVVQQPLIIGTHALLSEKVQLQNLGLLIIDEQHRFGVKQRAQLRNFSPKGTHLGASKSIHLLSMTATPIPRTMALLLYGDLKLSTIKEKPVGRKKILTKVVDVANRMKAYQFVDNLIAKDNQAFVVCPTIAPSVDDEANVMNQLFQTTEEKKSVTSWYKELVKLFPHRKIGMLHGKLNVSEKEAVMNAFRAGEIDLLVTTTVIEVGVDVPNASIMIIEGADRFGLAQLHQLRGRVGRNDKQAFCFLFPSSSDKANNARLKCLEEIDDGFELAEKDLQLRGPGELTGFEQSGIPPLRYASLHNSEFVVKVRQVAELLIHDSQFQQSFQRFWRLHHPE